MEWNEAIIDRHLTAADLIHTKGRIVYTGNWYTSISLTRYIMKKYGWLFVGTVKFAENKARVGYDIPFHSIKCPRRL